MMFVMFIVQYPIRFLFPSYTLHIIVKDDTDELCHNDIEQLKQILDDELKETEQVHHVLEAGKRNHLQNSDNKDETYVNARTTVAIPQVWLQTTYCRW